MEKTFSKSTIKNSLVVLRGGGDIASGIAQKIFRSGFPTIITETENPTMVRRTVSFAECIYSGQMEIEGLFSEMVQEDTLTEKFHSALSLLEKNIIPVLVDPECEILKLAKPQILIDAILAKKNLGTHKDSAQIVIGVGPGFNAGSDCNAVIETARGHDIGRIIFSGCASENTGVPGPIGGYTTERLLRSPEKGKFKSIKKIGDKVSKGELVAKVDEFEIFSEIPGVIRGLIRDDLSISKGFKVGDIDPRAKPEHCMTISDKSRSIAGGVLEAILILLNETTKKRTESKIDY